MDIVAPGTLGHFPGMGRNEMHNGIKQSLASKDSHYPGKKIKYLSSSTKHFRIWYLSTSMFLSPTTPSHWLSSHLEIFQACFFPRSFVLANVCMYIYVCTYTNFLLLNHLKVNCNMVALFDISAFILKTRTFSSIIIIPLPHSRNLMWLQYLNYI